MESVEETSFRSLPSLQNPSFLLAAVLSAPCPCVVKAMGFVGFRNEIERRRCPLPPRSTCRPCLNAPHLWRSRPLSAYPCRDPYLLALRVREKGCGCFCGLGSCCGFHCESCFGFCCGWVFSNGCASGFGFDFGSYCGSVFSNGCENGIELLSGFGFWCHFCSVTCSSSDSPSRTWSMTWRGCRGCPLWE